MHVLVPSSIYLALTFICTCVYFLCVCLYSYQSLGQIGCVTKLLNPTVLEVLINGKKQTYIALCLLPAPGGSASKRNITSE